MKLFAWWLIFVKIVINKLYVYNKKSYRKVIISGISLLKMIIIYMYELKGKGVVFGLVINL